MRQARISKRQVFPIIITLLVQFHLPHLSLSAASAVGIPAGQALRIVADFNQARHIPYREGYESSDVARHTSRLLKSNKATPVKGQRSSAVRSQRILITAYSSTKDQTDSSPCITANGYNVCKNNTENVIAANFLPFGTRVKIPELFGDREFVVQDRMNRRYGQRVDVWMTSRQKAKIFGVKRATIVVVPKEQKSAPQLGATQIAANY